MMKWSLLVRAKPISDNVFDDRHMTMEWTDFRAKDLKDAKKKILKLLKTAFSVEKRQFHIQASPYLDVWGRSQMLDGSKLIRLRGGYKSGKKLLKMKDKDLDKVFVVGYGPKQWEATS